MTAKLVGIALLALGLVACNNPPLPRYTATVGTYSVQEGNRDKVGIALLSSFDPDYPIPQKEFEIRIFGPDGLRASHVFRHPTVNKSDWFADPDLDAGNGIYTVEAIINGRRYQKSFQLDTNSYLDYPLDVTLDDFSLNRVTASWGAVPDSQVYFVTLNQKIPGEVKPRVLQDGYTTDPRFVFENLRLRANQRYFVGVDALSMDPRTTHSRLIGPFNAAYGQSDQEVLVDAAGNLRLVDSEKGKVQRTGNR